MSRRPSVFFRLRLPGPLYGLALAVLGSLGSCTSDSTSRTLPPPTGHYEGRVSYQGADLRAALDLREVRPGQLQADLHFPELQGLGFPAENLTYTTPQLHFERQPGGRRANLAVDAIREGDFLRGFLTTDSVKADLLLVRRGQPESRPYREIPLSFRRGPLALHGTLLLPTAPPADTTRRLPAVVLLHGRPTPHQRDLHAYADLLARHGFAALLFDRRDAAHSAAAGLPELALDAEAAAQALRHYPALDSTRVGFWALGPGGEVAARAAGALGRKAAFVVALGAAATTPAAHDRQLMAGALRQAQVPAPAAGPATQLWTRLERYVRGGGLTDTSQLHQLLQDLRAQPWAAATPLPAHVPTAEQIRTDPRWRDWLLDPRAAWQPVRCPVLLLYGGPDPAFNAREAAQRLRGVVGYRRGSAVRVYPAANQELMLPAGVRPDTDGRWDWARPAPGALEDMLTWMQQAVK